MQGVQVFNHQITQKKKTENQKPKKKKKVSDF